MAQKYTSVEQVDQRLVEISQRKQYLMDLQMRCPSEKNKEELEEIKLEEVSLTMKREALTSTGKIKAPKEFDNYLKTNVNKKTNLSISKGKIKATSTKEKPKAKVKVSKK